MQVAKLFASLGFKIDTADLSHFESLLNKAQGEMSQFAKDLNFVNQKLKTMKTRFGQANDALKDTDIAKAADRVAKAVDKYVKNAKEIVDIDSKVERVFKDTGVRLDLLSNKLDGGTSAWNRYEQQVKEATTRMREFTAAARERQSVNPPRGTGAGSGANQGGGAGGRGSGGRGNNGHDNEQGGMSGVLLGGQKFGKAFVGQMAMGGALGLGYLTKEAVQTGREIDSMIFKLQAVSRSTQEFQSNLKYVRETAQYLAVDVEEFGNAYAQIFQGAKGKYSQTQIQDMFTGFNEYFKTLKMSADDQKGALRGISQMFGKEKVQAQELILQVGQRTAGMVKVFADANDMTVAQLLKTMELGKTTTDMVVKAGLASAKAAKAMGTLPDALKTSVSAQARFTNELKWLAHTILKIVDPALAKMFDLMAEALKIIKPIVTGVAVMFSWLVGLVEILIELPLESWIIIATLSMTALGLAMLAGGNAAIFAARTFTFLASALKLLRAALPIAALLGMLWVLGELDKWKKDQDAGIETFTWIDLMNAKIQLFFSEAELGWLNFKLATIEAYYAVKDLFSLNPQKAITFIEDYGDDIKRGVSGFSPTGRGAIFLYDQIMGGIQGARIPVDVNVNVKMPDGSVQSSTTSSDTGLKLGGMGSTP